MITLYEAHQAECDMLEKRGYKNIVAMAKIMTSPSQVSRSLNGAVTSGGVSKWYLGKNNPTMENERRAGDWLASQNCQAPIAPAAPDNVLMVVCPGNQDKVQKVLAMLGCEVVEL